MICLRITKLLLLLGLAGCLLPLCAADTSTAGECFQNFSTEFENAKALLPQKFGDGWTVDNLPPEIGEELRALTKQSEELSDESSKLDSRAVALQGDEDLLSHSENWLKTRQDTLEGKYKDLNEENESLQKQIVDFNERFGRHQANQCVYPPDNPGVCAAYNAEKNQLDAEARQLEERQNKIEKRYKELDEEKSALDDEVGPLASRRTVLEETRTNLEQDQATFTSKCEEAATRAKVLAQIIPVSGTKPGPGNQQDPNKAFKGLGQEFAAGAFKKFVVSTEAPGIAMTAADVITAGVDERTKEISRNILLIGDYALALKRLKEQGHLQPGDPSYDALRHMEQETGNDMPIGQAEFTWQAVSSENTLLEGLAATAGHYASQKVEHIAGDIMRHLSVADKQTIGKAGYQVFKKAISIDIEAGANKGTELLLKGSAEGVQEQRKKALDRKAESH
ncbi:MAG TPA: hypothetical protein VK738_19715 [Terriglobales bacterium]|jgi:hypothetical protein|nr:hypothetical protein [Terriglobales bacterium]